MKTLIDPHDDCHIKVIHCQTNNQCRPQRSNDDTEVALTIRRQRTLRHKDRLSSARKTPAEEDCCPTRIASAPSVSPTTVLRQETESASQHGQQHSKHASTGDTTGMIQAAYIALKSWKNNAKVPVDI